jgi:hypothetical protein
MAEASQGSLAPDFGVRRAKIPQHHKKVSGGSKIFEAKVDYSTFFEPQVPRPAFVKWFFPPAPKSARVTSTERREFYSN